MASVTLKRVVVGRAIATHKAEHQLLPKVLALPVFSSDPLSSNAYATEEMMLVLSLAGAASFVFMLPIAAVIATVLTIVVVSYRQTVRAYPGGGGSYIVAHENLGTLPGLVAGAALLSDYVLTVSVSVAAGVHAIVSAAPSLAPQRVTLSLAIIVLIALANLRGVREAGTLFAIPTYGFVVMVYVTLGTGLFQCLDGCPRAATADLELETIAPLSLFLILRAFASGSTALTGVEAISNGVQAFRRPQSHNAATTLAVMATMTLGMFIGITVLARALHVRTNDEIAATKSVLAQIGETVFGGGTAAFYALQIVTALILILAANTAYQDFPRLSAILARDRFMPAQFRNRGDRLVFSNGILVLSALAMLLIWIFDADVTALIQLYLIGVFTAFTLSQTGMVRRWLRVRSPGWRRSAVINAIGAVATGVVLVIISITKFTHGAWIPIAATPVIVAFFLGIHHHYGWVYERLRERGLRGGADVRNTFVLLVSDLGPATIDAVAYLRALRPSNVLPLHMGPDRLTPEVRDAWARLAPRLGALREPAGGRSWRALRAQLRSLVRDPDDFVTVVIAEDLSSSSLLAYSRRSRFWLKFRLFFERGIVVTNVPLVAEEHAIVAEDTVRPTEPERSVVLIPVSGVHDATVRAVLYARSLGAAHVEGLFFAGERDEVSPILEEWSARGIEVPLSVVEAPFRDVGRPLVEEVRRHTSRGDSVVTVVLPEFVVKRWWHHLLHNQTAFYIKRLLLLEPRVVVTSVPYHLSDHPTIAAPMADRISASSSAFDIPPAG